MTDIFTLGGFKPLEFDLFISLRATQSLNMSERQTAIRLDSLDQAPPPLFD